MLQNIRTPTIRDYYIDVNDEQVSTVDQSAGTTRQAMLFNPGSLKKDAKTTRSYVVLPVMSQTARLESINHKIQTPMRNVSPSHLQSLN